MHCFLYMMKNLPKFAEKPELIWDDPYFDMLLEEAAYAGMNRDQRRKYRNATKMINDYYNTINYAVETTKKDSLEQVARRMLADHVSIETIMKYTDLSEEQILSLAVPQAGF